ncbi:MAG: flagellar biosynthesis anti-sigma factor FlgM [Planctomycetota bacterium]
MEIRGPGEIPEIRKISEKLLKPNFEAVSAESRPLEDRVELSDVARILSELKKIPDIRPDKVEALKTLIARGEFETPERIDGAVDRLMDELLGR